MSEDKYKKLAESLMHERAARAEARSRRRAQIHYCRELEERYGHELDGLQPGELAALADDALPGGHKGINFIGYTRRHRRGIADTVVRPLLLKALSQYVPALPED